MEELVEQVAANVRRITKEKKRRRADLRRELGIADRRTFEARWNGSRPFNIRELVIIADFLGVRVADFVQPEEEVSP
jgi:hypothetical protein